MASRDDLVQTLLDAGVVGTSMGDLAPLRLADPSPVLVVNGVEAEPSYLVDTLLIQRSSRELAEMLGRLKDLGYRRVVVGLNEWSVEEAAPLADRAADAGFDIAEVPDEAAGLDDGVLLAACLRKHIPPGGAASAGATVVDLETVYHMHRAVFKGKPMTTKLVQLAGRVEEASVLEVPIGARAADVAARVAPGVTAARVAALGADARLESAWRTAEGHGVVGKATDVLVVLEEEADAETGLELLAPAERITEVAGLPLYEVPLDAGNGAMAAAAVRPGQAVAKGAILGLAAKGKGANVHAPATGIVREARRDAVVLRPA